MNGLNLPMNGLFNRFGRDRAIHLQSSLYILTFLKSKTIAELYQKDIVGLVLAPVKEISQVIEQIKMARVV